MEPTIVDRGSHIEVVVGVSMLCGPDLPHVVARATDRFGRKPVLVLCDDAEDQVDLEEAYRIGVGLSSRFPGPIAVVLRGRPASEAEFFTEVVAANRGARVRYFDDAAAARSWLAA